MRMAAYLRLAIVAVAAFFSLATPAPRMTRNYPRWKVMSDADRAFGCADVRVWVAKSGKQGAGVTLRVLGRDGTAPCRVELRAARLLVAGVPVEPAALPAPLELAPGTGTHVYLAYPFDNEATWNAGAREGELALTLAVDGAVQPEWRLKLHHWLDDHHRARSWREP